MKYASPLPPPAVSLSSDLMDEKVSFCLLGTYAYMHTRMDVTICNVTVTYRLVDLLAALDGLLEAAGAPVVEDLQFQGQSPAVDDGQQAENNGGRDLMSYGQLSSAVKSDRISSDETPPAPNPQSIIS